MITAGTVTRNGTVIGFFTIRFDGVVIFSLTSGGSLGDVLEKANRLDQTIALVPTPETE